MKLYFYKKENGREPVKDNIQELKKREQAKIFKVLENIKDRGFGATSCEFRQIESELWEIKIKLPKNGYRIFYVMSDSYIMVLLHSYKKQSQKAPKNEISVAFKRMKDFINNKERFNYD